LIKESGRFNVARIFITSFLCLNYMLYKSACQIHFCDNGLHESISKITRTLREGLENEILLPFYVVPGGVTFHL